MFRVSDKINLNKGEQNWVVSSLHPVDSTRRTSLSGDEKKQKFLKFLHPIYGTSH